MYKIFFVGMILFLAGLLLTGVSGAQSRQGDGGGDGKPSNLAFSDTAYNEGYVADHTLYMGDRFLFEDLDAPRLNDKGDREFTARSRVNILCTSIHNVNRPRWFRYRRETPREYASISSRFAPLKEFLRRQGGSLENILADLNEKKTGSKGDEELIYYIEEAQRAYSNVGRTSRRYYRLINTSGGYRGAATNISCTVTRPAGSSLTDDGRTAEATTTTLDSKYWEVLTWFVKDPDLGSSRRTLRRVASNPDYPGNLNYNEIHEIVEPPRGEAPAMVDRNNSYTENFITGKNEALMHSFAPEYDIGSLSRDHELSGASNDVVEQIQRKLFYNVDDDPLDENTYERLYREQHTSGQPHIRTKQKGPVYVFTYRARFKEAFEEKANEIGGDAPGAVASPDIVSTALIECRVMNPDQQHGEGSYVKAAIERTADARDQSDLRLSITCQRLR